MQMHSFALTEMFQKRVINACPWVNPIPIYGHICLWVHYTSREPNQVCHGYLLHFVASKFSRTKMCDIYPLAERAFNFLNMAFFETKYKTGTKTFWKYFRNVSFMTVKSSLVFRLYNERPILGDDHKPHFVANMKSSRFYVDFM